MKACFGNPLKIRAHLEKRKACFPTTSMIRAADLRLEASRMEQEARTLRAAADVLDPKKDIIFNRQ